MAASLLGLVGIRVGPGLVPIGPACMGLTLGHVGPKFGPNVWVYMGLFSKEWAWIEGNGLRRGKGAA